MKEGLTFDDVLIEPRYSTIRSRHEVKTNAKVGTLDLKIPIVSAPMDKVSDYEMCLAIGKLGGMGVLHRFMPLSEQYEKAERLKKEGVPVVCAIGYKDLRERVETLMGVADMFLVDVANGHTRQMKDTITYLKNHTARPIIAGNIATYEAAVDYQDWGVDVARVGIGPGRFCQTRTVTGCGVPQLTAILETRKGFKGPIIADGGITKSGDITKALGAGASLVMLGNLLSGTDETPGEIYTENNQQYKVCRGMASREASGRADVTPEGVSIKIPYKGPVTPIINELVMGLKSGMSYVNARTLDELVTKTEFIKLSPSGQYESKDRTQR